MALAGEPVGQRRLTEARRSHERDRRAVDFDRIGVERHHPALMDHNAHRGTEQEQPDVGLRRANRGLDDHRAPIAHKVARDVVDREGLRRRRFGQRDRAEQDRQVGRRFAGAGLELGQQDRAVDLEPEQAVAMVRADVG